MHFCLLLHFLNMRSILLASKLTLKKDDIFFDSKITFQVIDDFGSLFITSLFQVMKAPLMENLDQCFYIIIIMMQYLINYKLASVLCDSHS